MKKNTLIILLVILSFLLSVKNYIDTKILYCDLGTAFFAERNYTYPILRKIDDPSNYGKDSKNPLTTDSRYRDCELFEKYFKWIP